MENFSNQAKISTKIKKFKWIAEENGCFKCKSLDGRIFDERPRIEEVSHPNCKCEVVEVDLTEANMAKLEGKIEITRRDLVVDGLTNNVKTRGND